jgi:hypothetical protein
MNSASSPVFRTDLTDNSINAGSASGGIDPSNSTNTIATSNANKQYYDLRMGYLGTDGNPWYGHLTGAGGFSYLSAGDLVSSLYSPSNSNYSVLDIPKDDSVKIDLSGLQWDNSNGNNDVNDTLKLLIRYKFTNSSTGAIVDTTNINVHCNALMEATFTYNPTNGSGLKQYKSLLSAGDPSACSVVNGIATNKMLGTVITYNTAAINILGYYYAEENSLIADVFTTAARVIPPSSSGSLTLALKPLSASSAYNVSASIGLMKTKCQSLVLDCNKASSAVAGPFTTITSTGYYGGVTRKLVANVDRQSGTLYDLFDYVINKN